MNKENKRWKYPVCRALNCKFNSRDTCIRDEASEIPGHRCPHFCNRETTEGM